MPFKFSLTKILSIIGTREAMKKIEVSESRSKIIYIQNRIKQIETELKATSEKYRGQDVISWAPFAESKVSLDKQRLSKADGLLISEKEILDRKIFELNQVLMQKKALESLRDKRKKEYTREVRRKEQKKLDDMFRQLEINRENKNL